jgi:hypothetical protein
VYVKAAEEGLGIFDMASPAPDAECAEFMPIVGWVERQRDFKAAADGKVVDLAHRRWTERNRAFSLVGSRP